MSRASRSTSRTAWRGVLRRRIRMAAVFVGFVSLVTACGAAVAQTAPPADPSPAVPVSPRAFGFDLPSGRLVPGGDRRVETLDDRGKEVVGRVHVEVAGAYIVMLPDGRLVARTKGEARPTDREFTPASMDEVAADLTASQLKGFRITKGRRYLFLSNCSDTFTEGTGRIMETMFPGLIAYLRSLGLRPREPEVPLVVIMFRTEADFQRFKPVPPGMVAYYNVIENQVILYEQSGLAQVDPELAVRQKIAMIAHENVHQILHNVGIQRRLAVWPQWFAEGVAEFFAPTEVDRQLRWKGAGQVNDLRMYELERYLKARDSDSPAGQMVEQTVQAARLSSTGYATAWALVHYLARYERTRFSKYFQQVSETQPLTGAADISQAGTVPSNRPRFVECFGDDFAALEERLLTHLKQLPYQPPFADQPHIVAQIALAQPGRNSRMANVFLTEDIARRWIQETLQRVAADKREGARVSLTRHGDRAAAERFADQWLRGE